MAVKLLKWGNGVGLLIPSFAAKSCGFKPGSFVRIVVLEDEIRVRHVTAPRVDDADPGDHADGGAKNVAVRPPDQW
jgi:antitoxin component of MazEF toxin-antitoxin module